MSFVEHAVGAGRSAGMTHMEKITIGDDLTGPVTFWKIATVHRVAA